MEDRQPLNEQEWIVRFYASFRTPLYIDDTGGISVAQIAACPAHEARENISVIDHIHFRLRPRPRNQVQEVTEISKSLKVLAKDLSGPLVASTAQPKVDSATTSARCSQTCVNPARSSRTQTS